MTEALVVGRVGVDLTPATPRTTLAAAESFVRAVGGFAGNIATGLARLGVRTAVVSAVGDDGHGDHVRAFLTGEGVDVGSIVTRPGSRTQVAFFEVWPPEHFPVTFYRPAPAPETQLAVADLPAELIESAPLVILSGTLLAAEPGRWTALEILDRRRATRARRPRSITLLDLDWRPTLWDDPAEAPPLMERAAGLADVLIGSDAEFAAVRLSPTVGPSGRGPSGRGPSGRGPGLIALKHGPDGVSSVTAAGRRSVPGIAVEVLCGTGSGDALTAAFAAGLLRGVDPAEALARGNAAGAIVATRLMCSTAMPTPDEIDRMLSRVAAGRQAALS
jgi:5-dehydro-2-deoxygluconokinase